MLSDTTRDALSGEASATDLGPLAWVFDELRKSLDGANKAIKRFVRETEQARVSDLEAVDPASLRIARQQLHQAVGALEMVGLAAPAQVVRAMESAVQRFVQKPLTCTPESAEKVERAGFALVEYLESVLNGRSVPPVALFPQYRDVQEIAVAERIHPADLWSHEHRGLQAGPAQGVTPLQCEPALRSLFDRLVLLVVKTQSAAAAQQLSKLSAGLSAGASDSRVQSFWRVTAAYFEALAQGLLPMDVYVKRAASRVLLQFATLSQGQRQISETLMHDLLFMCAQATGLAPEKSAHLAVVRSAFGLDRETAVDYQKTTLGRYDPAILAQARKRIQSAKESWSLFSGGDASRARQVIDHFGLLGDSLLKLHPASTVLAQALVRASDQAARDARGVRPELAMEVATTTLFLEAAFEDFDPQAPEMTERTQALATRLDAVLAGEAAQPLEPWMEQLYRRVSDRQTMGSVVGELKASLTEAEKSLDQFFRNPVEKGGLPLAVSQLAQMRGVLSVLGLDQAVQAVSRMRTSVEQILDTEVDEDKARTAGTFQQLGNNLSALSFMVDMLNYQPALAKKLFVFDDELGELVPMMGRSPAAAQPVHPSHEAAQEIGAGVQRVVEGVEAGVDLADLSQRLGDLASQASLAEQPSVAKAAQDAAEAVIRADAQAGAQALAELAQSQFAPLSADPGRPDPSLATDDGDEDDLQGIFLEEAREVVGQGLEAIAQLLVEPGELEHLTALRRAFHTLKGSSRMVALNEFGEAAWAMEQMLNAALAEQKPAASDMLRVAGEAMRAFGHWVEDIAASGAQHWSAQPFRHSAESWRQDGRYLPLAAGAETASPDHAVAAHATPTVDADAPVALSIPASDATVDTGEPPIPGEPIDVVELSFPSGTEIAPEPGGTEPGDMAGQADFVDTSPYGDELNVGHLFVDVPGAVQDLPVIEDIDFSALQSLSGASAGHPPPAPVAAEEEVLPPLDETALPIPAPEGDEAAADARFTGEAVWTAEPSPAPGVAPVAAEGLVENDDEGSALADEQVRIIGPLQIGIRLYNVYLNEADEWSRRLGVCLSEWALERHEPLPSDAEALAHSLAGSSATVGFEALSGIARALEHALAALSQHQHDGVAATEAQASLFVDASEEIRRLLHQFAAGFLKEPSPELLQALHRVVHDMPAAALDADSVDAGPDIEITSRWGQPEPVQDMEVSLADADGMAEPPAVHDETVFAALPGVPASVGDGPVQDIDDDIDVLDTIDADLFPVFADEAAELLPQLGSALRQWVARPDNGSARAEVLRNLHTLKGSARLAGALRLGEMVHRMETQAERLGSEVRRSEDVEPLQHDFDAISARFEMLRQTDLSSQDVVRTAAELRPSADPAGAMLAPSGATDGGPDASIPALASPAVLPVLGAPTPMAARTGAAVRVRPELLDRLMNQAGEVMISRSRMENELVTLRGSLKDLTGNLERLRLQLRDIELQAETQMQSRLAQAKDANQSFDPLEFDRFTRVQELTRMMAESVNDVATVQRNLQRAVESTEDSLVAQARQTRELQRDLLRTRMVEFEGISERLYRVVRQASKETGKQVRLDIVGGNIEMDRGVLDRMTGAFEHLLRNCVVHGIEPPEQRLAAGKPAEGQIEIRLTQELNDVAVVFRDDGAGLDLQRLLVRAQEQGFVAPGAALSDDEVAQLVFTAGLSTASEVSALAGRGVGMDVVRSDVVALGGRIVTHTQRGQGTSFELMLPLTTAVTQVVMLRAGELTWGVPSNLVQIVRRVGATDLARAYATGTLQEGGEDVPFYWAGALMQSSTQSQEMQHRTLPVVIFRSAAQRVAMHVDEVLGNQEVVVKNLGPQLSRLPGLAGISMLASGAVALIYNPVALSTVYGAQVADWAATQQAAPAKATSGDADALLAAQAVSAVPLVLVVDDSITVRRVTQRLLQREGYRVSLAADGLQALERLQQERPTVVLSDIEMPRMDGFDLVRNIRADARLADLPVIMITSRIAEKHREHARELGVNHYLGKPYSEDELLALIAHHAQVAAEA
ncbi:MAG TPA: Hpt domain-containing protein [Hydrogenophaga sp.]|uniref:response regulator n=1 Tax=Hydrogenophaga sp. TaxID=1904254 RepID=UPI002C6913A4|nr:response regulator [Hydrogenophaga sp.]HMN93593.1 Hpt domain-containing protein [Hydrogenophaga sp.]HMP09088.1 Hpt domain-containing protein [Hydrogenophaga sp.]